MVGERVPMSADGGSGGRTADLVVIEDEFGTALVGAEEAIAEFTRQEGFSLPVVAAESGVTVTTLAPRLFGARAVGSAYLVGISVVESARRARGTTVTYHRMVRDSNGTIRSNARIPAPGAAAIAPQMAALMALEAAISAQFDQIHEHLDVIEDKVDEVLRLAAAERLGDIYGHHRVLARKARAMADGDALTATDWSSLAGLGPDLEVGVERLRMHVIKQAETLDSRLGPGKRAEQLEAMVRKNRLGETLQLLVVAQKSLFLWQRLRLEQVRVTELEHFEQTIASARSILREQYRADVELVVGLRELLTTHAVLKTSEAHHKIVSRSLTKHRRELESMLDQFVQARNLQLATWEGRDHATIAEAMIAAKVKAAALATSGRRQLARGGAGIVAWIDPDAKKPAVVDAAEDRSES